MSTADFAAVLFLFIPMFDALAVFVIWRVIRLDLGHGSVRRGWRRAPATLRDRAVVATAIWIGVSFIALIGIIHLARIDLDGDVLVLLLVAGTILPSLANFAWLVRYYSGGFGSDADNDPDAD